MCSRIIVVKVYESARAIPGVYDYCGHRTILGTEGPYSSFRHDNRNMIVRGQILL